MKMKDLTGQRFGKLTALERIKREGCRGALWRCECDCGNTTEVFVSNLTRKHTTSCGCERQKGQPIFFLGNSNNIEKIDDRTLKLSAGGNYTYLSPEDYKYVKHLYWQADDKGRFYTIRNRKHYKLHRVLLGLECPDTGFVSPNAVEVDHIDRDSRNNRRDNLRICNRAQNIHNRACRGYTKCGNRWRVVITAFGQHHHIGMFDTPEEALAARVAAEKKYFGVFAPKREG